MADNDRSEDQTKRKPVTVILWGREDVIGQGVEFLLRSRKDWEVVRVLGDNDFSELAKAVELVNPKVVIIYQGDCSDDSQWALQLMKNRPGIRVITFSLENSSLEVFDRKKVWVKGVTDLLDIV